MSSHNVELCSILGWWQLLWLRLEQWGTYHLAIHCISQCIQGFARLSAIYCHKKLKALCYNVMYSSSYAMVWCQWGPQAVFQWSVSWTQWPFLYRRWPMWCCNLQARAQTESACMLVVQFSCTWWILACYHSPDFFNLVCEMAVMSYMSTVRWCTSTVTCT